MKVDEIIKKINLIKNMQEKFRDYLENECIYDIDFREDGEAYLISSNKERPEIVRRFMEQHVEIYNEIRNEISKLKNNVKLIRSLW